MKQSPQRPQDSAFITADDAFDATNNLETDLSSINDLLSSDLISNKDSSSSIPAIVANEAFNDPLSSQKTLACNECRRKKIKVGAYLSIIRVRCSFAEALPSSSAMAKNQLVVRAESGKRCAPTHHHLGSIA